MTGKIQKNDQEWREQLSEEQYNITRLKGTERPFSGKYYNFKENGTYQCVCCGAQLFSSQAKYDSGSGWPSFYQPLEEGNIRVARDNSYGMIRTELLCNHCDAHLGHIFDDGPQPTGQRYCINSASLNFKPQ